MGRGRAPCCDKSKVKKGPWTPAEDLRLITYIHKHGHGNWRALPKQAGLLRCGKSCRLRWINYLRPGVKRGNFSTEEEEIIIKLHESVGNKWSKIASQLPGRTDNEIKNVWNTHLKKKIGYAKKVNPYGDDETKELSMTNSSSSPSSPSSSFVSNDNPNMALFEKKQELVTMVATQSSPTNEPKQASSSSSSGSSYASDFSNSNQVDVTMAKEEMGSLYNFGGPCEVHNLTYEVNNHDIVPNEVGEIPLECDIDFWNMLDSLGTLQSNEAQPDVFEASETRFMLVNAALGSVQSNEAQPHVFEASQTPKNFREECDEIECRKWLRCLESELGLDATSDGDHGNPPNDAKPEIDQDMPCFQMWPSSPHSFDV